MILVITSILVAVLMFFMVVLLVTYVRRSRSLDIFHRLRRHHVVEVTKEAETEDLLRLFYRFIKRTAKPFLTWNLPQSLDLKLRRAGIPFLGAEFIVTAIVSAAFVGIVVYMLTLNQIFAIAAAAIVPLAFWIAVIVMTRRRQNAFTEQLGDCLITVANALRAGYGFQQAMSLIAREMEPPISEEFAHVTADVAMGITLENALEQMNKRVGSADFDLVVTAVLIQREVGGNLAQILDSISDTITERIRMKREVLALTAQGRFSAIVLFVLPFAAGAYMYTANPDNFMILFEDPMGQMALVVSFIMAIIGFIVIRKIVDIDA